VTPGDDGALEAVTVATVAVAARYIIIYALFSVVWTHFLLYSGGGISSLLCVANALPPMENHDGLWWETDGDDWKTYTLLLYYDVDKLQVVRENKNGHTEKKIDRQRLMGTYIPSTYIHFEFAQSFWKSI